MGKILIVDDEKGIREIFSLLLEERGHTVREASSGEEALTIIPLFSPDLLLLDMNLPGISGIDLLERVKREFPKTSVIIMTAFGSIRSAVEATRLGAYDYLEKPVDNDELLLLIARALEVKELNRRVEELQERLTEPVSLKRIVGVGPKMQSIFQALEKVARVDGTVLITGESVPERSLWQGPSTTPPSEGRDPSSSSTAEPYHGSWWKVNSSATPREPSPTLETTSPESLSSLREEPSSSTKWVTWPATPKSSCSEPWGRGKSPESVERRQSPWMSGSSRQPTRPSHNVGQGRPFPEDLYWRLAVLSLHLPLRRGRKRSLP